MSVHADRRMSPGETAPLGAGRGLTAWLCSSRCAAAQWPQATLLCPWGSCLTANTSADPKPQQKGETLLNATWEGAGLRSGMRRHPRKVSGKLPADCIAQALPTCLYKLDSEADFTKAPLFMYLCTPHVLSNICIKSCFKKWVPVEFESILKMMISNLSWTTGNFFDASRENFEVQVFYIKSSIYFLNSTC